MAKKQTEINHEYLCDYCGKPATINLQNTWHKYDIDDEGEFDEINSWEGDTNEFYCDACAKKEGV